MDALRTERFKSASREKFFPRARMRKPTKRSRVPMDLIYGMSHRYRVTFMERTNQGGVPSEKPPDYVEIDLAPGVVLDRTFLERTEPQAEHVEGRLEEDDDFLSIGSETWDYEVADGRTGEFLAALRNSQMAIECVSLDNEPTPP